MKLMSVMRDTSHSLIDPYGPSDASPVGESSRYLSIALFSSIKDCGENAGGPVLIVQTVCDIDPDEPSNAFFLPAGEFTQAGVHRFCVNAAALKNIASMFTTFDTSHFEMSPLNVVASQNMPFMSVTLDTSHFEMSLLNDDAP